MMESLSKLIQNNRTWARRAVEENPAFFDTLSKQQNPDYLWIGCSDSRVPANLITGLLPGEMFVHRNIANMVVHTDINLLSVLQFAVDALEVKHVIVVGHYGCGGVQAAMENRSYGLLGNWLRHIQDVEALHATELKALEGETRVDRFCELNVITQAENVRRTSVLEEAWDRGQSVEIHSWIFSLKDGQLRRLQEPIRGPQTTNQGVA